MLKLRDNLTADRLAEGLGHLGVTEATALRDPVLAMRQAAGATPHDVEAFARVCLTHEGAAWLLQDVETDEGYLRLVGTLARLFVRLRALQRATRQRDPVQVYAPRV